MMFRSAVLITLAATFTFAAEPSPAIAKLTPVIYNNTLVKSFLSQFLSLTEAQMVQSDLAFAEARAKIFPLSEKAKATQAKLETALATGAAPSQWRPLIQSLTQTQAQMLEYEFTALQKFQSLLDGDQKHKLNRITDLSMTTNPEGQPVLAYAVEQ